MGTLILLGALLPATGHARATAFDHFTTGFQLLGMHRNVLCENCHVGGIFKGTPTTCVACHASGARFGATSKPATHIVSSNDCAQCHTPFGWRPVAFFDHMNVYGTCSSCHNGMSAQGKPNNHPATTAECNGCHVVNQPWTKINYPSNHIPISATAQCTNCHTGGNFAVTPTLTNIHLYAPSTSSNCALCHGPTAAPTFAIPAINFSIVTTPANHVTQGGACESCHVGAGSSVAATPVVDGAKFTNSAMNHAGITTCVNCHGPTVTGTTFYGISKIVVMPATSPMGASAHIPTGTACETCHLGSMPAGLVPGNASKTVPGTGFQSPAPTTAMIHNGITAGCSTCHEAPDQWVDMTANYPLNPGVLSTGTTQYFGFQTRPGKTASATNIADSAHPPTGDCIKCHTRTDYFEGQIKPSNHIPTAAGATCANCHTSSDFSVLPTLTNIHLYAPSTSSNCTQCHGPTVAPGFAIPAANFSIVTTPANHVTQGGTCESCHVGAGSSIAATPVVDGQTFKNSAMSHAGITSNCTSCHGPTVTGTTFYGISKIVVMPATAPVGPNAHIPSGNTCETCHLPSTPSGFVPANATASVPGTAFATPVPTTAMIHSGISSGCSSCHDSNYLWLDQNKYPISPTVLTSGAQYTGFQTRPVTAASTYSVADNAHPTSGDCSQCHSGTTFFDGNVKPSNHIPTSATATCANCHTSTDFSVMPTLANIHLYAPSTTSNCTQCHGPTVAPGFAIPAANFSIVTTPANHVTQGGNCESCHVGAGSSIAATPVPNGAKFTNSAMSHAGITSNCTSCHGPTVTGTTFYGISKIVVMPATSPVGPNAHIPSGTTCETCHLPSTPAGFVPANATASVPGSAFATPVPTTAMIHSGISSGCSSCHDSNYLWLDQNKYPITPTVLTSGAQYTGFQTRPVTAASTYSVADGAHPTSGDCSQCHSGTTYFDGNVKPSNHIPTSATATCANCHTSSDFSVMPTLANIHLYAPSTTNNCTQCHGPTVAPGFAIPAANFSIVTTPANHVTQGGNCESCHVGAGSSIAATPVPNGAKFTNSAMSHAGITTCVSCHGPTVTGTTFYGISKIIVMPPTSPRGPNAHIPTGTACETCHLGSMPGGFVPANATASVPGSAFATPVPTTAMIHSGISSGCSSCHDSNYLWLDQNKYPISPTVLTSGAQYTGFQTRPLAVASTYNVADNAHPTSGDCSQCHTGTTYFDGNVKPSNHIPTSATATCANCHTTSDFSVMPTLANIHLYAPSTTNNCTQCHGPTVAPGFAIPAANFSIVTTPANHVTQGGTCESCHVGAGSSIAATPVPNGAKFTNSAMSHAGITTCVSCHGPTVTGTTFYGISKIIVMPATSPMGPTSHVPTGTACETCHLGSMPGGFVPANATASVPGSAFATPVPTTAMIHSGVTSGCTNCHESNYLWLDVNKYPIAPTVVTSGANYTGFQTRPHSGATTYSVSDASHTATGDCVTCHGTNFNYFTAQAEPSNHIPTLPSAACSDCHTTAGNYAVYTSNLTALHADVPSTCSTCHADGKGPFAGATGFAIVQMSTRGMHIPITNGGVPVECSGCHKSVTTFTGTVMSHMVIGDTGTSATGDACDACHEYGYRNKFYGVSINWTRDSPGHYICGAAGTPTSPNVTICPNGGSDCLTGCHQHQNQIPSQYKHRNRPPAPVASNGPAARPGTNVAADPANPTQPRVGGGITGRLTTAKVDHTAMTGACQSCHNGVKAAGKGPSHPATTLACGDCHSTLAWQPVLRLDHADVLGACVSCHNGLAAAGKPAGHLPSGNDCGRCHTTSAWKPAAFDHSAVVPGTCATCHNALMATGKPASHPATTLSCDSCHYVLGWAPLKPAQPAKKPVPRPVPPARVRTPFNSAISQ